MESDRERITVNIVEPGNQAFSNLTGWIADTVNNRTRWIIVEHWHSIELRAKTSTVWWIYEPRFPTVKRIMIAVADKRAYARLVQLLNPFHKLALSAQAAVCSVVYVSRNKQRIHAFGNA